MGSEEDRELLRRRIRAALARADEAFAGAYADELKDLLGLSQVDIDRVAPGGTAAEDYNKLISVVREASRINAAQADLVANIKKLGGSAVKIARLVPGLSALNI
jgi:hypothetical protein